MNAITDTDTELLALATDCEAAERRTDETGDALMKADDKRGVIEIPRALFRTVRDRELGLFIGPDKRSQYDEEEIKALCSLYRRLGRADVGKHGPEWMEAYQRCRAILEAWKDWRKATEAADARSGYPDAFKADCDAMDALGDLRSRIAVIPASTLAGVFAKARALKSIMLSDENTADRIRDELGEVLEPDEYTAALSLARDIIALAAREDA